MKLLLLNYYDISRYNSTCLTVFPLLKVAYREEGDMTSVSKKEIPIFLFSKFCVKILGRDLVVWNVCSTFGNDVGDDIVKLDGVRRNPTH